jgi:hypothetical protein
VGNGKKEHGSLLEEFFTGLPKDIYCVEPSCNNKNRKGQKKLKLHDAVQIL